ncbi:MULTISPECIES: ABC transporter permease [unclassified Terrabacter]|uniref:ABC transporter permease n=1 Tax=unclassified Terrabacter TaxID=2630222 RepID=UPI0006F77D29|nr:MULTISPECIES: ABC transporter permease [unclassified Terrabacter]KRB45571.1 ABC transporter [Terrabacter sp. Root181]KRF41421.1 ABC transporter [Terrabacter sp. Soil810]
MSTSAAPTTPGTSRAAASRRRVLAQSGFEVGSLLRNGEQLLVSLVLPAMALVGLSVTTTPSLGPGTRIDVATPGVIALCVISAAFTAQAISTAFDRRYAVLRYLGVTPLGRGGLVAAKVIATLAVEVLQIGVIAVLGLALGWRPEVSGIPYAVLFVVLGTWAFVALALLLAGTLRAEAVLAIANLVWVLLLAVGGVIVPRTELPAGVSHVVAYLPSAGLADGLRSALVDGVLNLPALAVVVAWGLVATVLAARLFRFDD